MRKIFANNLLALVLLALLAIGSAEATSPVPANLFVDLALYRPSTGQFFVRSSLTGSVTSIAVRGAG